MSQKPHRCWAFVADPRRYRILDAVANLTTDWWTTKGKPIQVGDHVIIWQARDAQGRRGVVAIAEILEGPQERSDVGNRYWVNAEDAAVTAERVRVRYIPLSEPLWIGGPQEHLLASLTVSRAHGGTIFHVTADQWQAIASAAGYYTGNIDKVESDVQEVKTRNDLTPTQKEALIQARRGQGQFRQALLEYWGGCAVVGCAVQSVLRASHVKPWSKSSDTERLDPANGLLLIANLDALFNEGLLSFDDDGRMLISDQLAQRDRILLGLTGGLRKNLTAQQQAYLKFHRNNEFR
jgi:hypothetical protein